MHTGVTPHPASNVRGEGLIHGCAAASPAKMGAVAGTDGRNRTDRMDAWRKNNIGVKLRKQDKFVRSPLDLCTTLFAWPLVRLQRTLLINGTKK